MSKFKRLSLAEAMELFPLMNEEAQKALKGGCSSCDGFGQTYSIDEYEQMEAEGTWTGGFVCGLGYVMPTVDVIGYSGLYCFNHGNYYTEDQQCGGCYYDDFDFCEEHGSYYERFDVCQSCISEYYENWLDTYYNYEYYPNTEENNNNNEENNNEDNNFNNYGDNSDWNVDDGNPNPNPNPHNPHPNPNPPVIVVPDPKQHDGVDVKNSNHFTFNTADNSEFDGQLKSILGSNSIIKNVLNYFDRGYVHLTFEVGEIKVKDSTGKALAGTSYASEESFHITFNEMYIDENGWNKIVTRDVTDYNWNNVTNEREALVVILTHEALHAKHTAVFYESWKEGNGNEAKGVQYLLENGYSQEFIDIFYIKGENGKWKLQDNEISAQKKHEYMKKYDHGVIDAALSEYRNDYK